MSGTRVTLVRHGQSTWNADGRWQGQADPPLSRLGERQAAEAAVRLLGMGAVDAVWASDLVRALTTAQAIATAGGVGVRADARLRERHAGPWQGLRRAEIDERFPDYLASGLRPDGYESDDDVGTRAFAVLDDLAAAHHDAHVVVVTHGGILRVLERALGDDGEGLIPNLSGRRLRANRAGGWDLGERVLLLGDDTVTVPGQI